MKKKLTTAIATCLIAGSAFAPAALAQDGTDSTDSTSATEHRRGEARDVENAKARAAEAIERRYEALDRMRAKLDEAAHVTDDHAASLRADYDAAERGLAALDEEIQAATTAAELEVLIPKIAVDYRVFLVIAPKSSGVAASDTIVAGSAHIVDDVVVDLQASIDRATDAGFDVDAVQKLVDQAVAAASDAAALAGPVAESVIDLDAADWQDPAEALLRQARSDLEEARASVRSAADDLRTAVELLKEIVRTET